MSRLDDKENDAIILVMQRLHVGGPLARPGRLAAPQSAGHRGNRGED
jgi:hypothetical protein